jgi:alpha-N-acetylglucosamine transferase
MTPSILTKIKCLQLQQYEKVCLLDADVVFLRSMDAILEVQTPADLSTFVGCIVRIYTLPTCKLEMSHVILLQGLFKKKMDSS